MLLPLAILLIIAYGLSNVGNAWQHQYCNASATVCLTPLKESTGLNASVKTTLYAGKDFRPFLRAFNHNRVTLFDTGMVAFDQDHDLIVVYSSGAVEPHKQRADWKSVRFKHVDGDPCSFITTLTYNYTPAAACSTGAFHE